MPWYEPFYNFEQMMAICICEIGQSISADRAPTGDPYGRAGLCRAFERISRYSSRFAIRLIDQRTVHVHSDTEPVENFQPAEVIVVQYIGFGEKQARSPASQIFVGLVL